MELIKEKINRKFLKEREKFYTGITKIAVDLEKKIICSGCELHSDCALKLIEEEGSDRKNIWGANISFDKPKESMIEFVSLINIRPTDKNFSMEIELPEVKAKLQEIVFNLIN